MSTAAIPEKPFTNVVALILIGVLGAIGFILAIILDGLKDGIRFFLVGKFASRRKEPSVDELLARVR